MAADKTSNIKGMDWFFMITVAVIYDLIQAGITLFFSVFVITLAIGPLISSIIITPFALLTFGIWFKMKGMRFTRWSKVASFGSGTIIELSPLNFLPGWTASVVATLILDRLEKTKLLQPLNNSADSSKIQSGTSRALKRFKR